MKILWVTNTVLPYIAQSMGIEKPVVEGWLTGLAEELLAKDDIELGICYPQNTKIQLMHGTIGKLQYYGFFTKYRRKIEYDAQLEKIFMGILEEFKPDVIHIMGTEYPHTLSMVNACSKKRLIDKMVISIQGLISEYAKVYLEGIPNYVVHKQTLRDFIKKDNLYKQKEKYERRGEFEIEALKKACNVIGRTEWDRKCCKAINPNIRYFENNETLRKEFYEGEWSETKCEKGRLFMSQGYYPIKGLHILLKALPKIAKKNFDVHLYIGGENILNKPHWKYGSYAKYIETLIKEDSLRDKVTFLGILQPEQIRQQYLKANIFVLPSIIENSPNSLGEAMLLGTPCVTAKVGGISSIISEKEGILYETGNVEQLSTSICKLLGDSELCCTLSIKSKKRAQNIHNGEKNCRELLEIYRSL